MFISQNAKVKIEVIAVVGEVIDEWFNSTKHCNLA